MEDYSKVLTLADAQPERTIYENVQKVEPGDMGLGQQGIFRKNDNHIVIDNGTGQFHACLQLADC